MQDNVVLGLHPRPSLRGDKTKGSRIQLTFNLIHAAHSLVKKLIDESQHDT